MNIMRSQYWREKVGSQKMIKEVGTLVSAYYLFAPPLQSTNEGPGVYGWSLTSSPNSITRIFTPALDTNTANQRAKVYFLVRVHGVPHATVTQQRTRGGEEGARLLWLAALCEQNLPMDRPKKRKLPGSYRPENIPPICSSYHPWRVFILYII